MIMDQDHAARTQRLYDRAKKDAARSWGPDGWARLTTREQQAWIAYEILFAMAERDDAPPMPDEVVRGLARLCAGIKTG